MPMVNDDRDEKQRLRDKFLEMIRHTDAAPVDQDARQRVGEAIGRSARRGKSEFSYTSNNPPRRPRR
jgi:hypothetical protein